MVLISDVVVSVIHPLFTYNIKTRGTENFTRDNLKDAFNIYSYGM